MYSFTPQNRNRSTAPTLPAVGPGVVAPAGIDGVSVPATTAGAVVSFRWPDRYRLARWFFMVESANPVHLAKTSLLIEDETQHLITLDGQGLIDSVGGLGVVGLRFRWQAFNRIVQPGDLWTFQVVNGNAVAVVPRLYFGLEVLP